MFNSGEPAQNLRGKTVWITGASSGIGEALAYQCAAAGAHLILSARRTNELDRVKKKCLTNSDIYIFPMDLSNTLDIPAKVAEVLATVEKVDILLNCAGISQRSLAKDTTLSVYRQVMEVNYFGTIQLSQALFPHFIERNCGCFVTISSVAGITGLPLRTAYCAAKHALEGYFAALRTELWKTNIKILVVRPGAVKTNIANNAVTGNGQKFSKKDPIIENGVSPERCAALIIEAIIKQKETLVVGSAKEKALFVLNRFLPKFVFNQVKTLG